MSEDETRAAMASETSPLLPTPPATVFPRLEIAIVCFASTAQSAAFFSCVGSKRSPRLTVSRSIFSFVAQQIYDTGDVPVSDVGFWSGMILRCHIRTGILTLTST